MPVIGSVQEFRKVWVKWWSAAQPGWRNTGSWPFSRDEALIQDWGQLSLGGKDGLFLVIISLAWWIHAQHPEADPMLDNAIGDVSWVMNHLVTSLSIDITSHGSLPSTAPPSSNTRIAHPTKTYRSKKRGRG